MNVILQVSFVPRSVDFALLLLRLWIGLTMFFNHGWLKLTHFSSMSHVLPDPLHVGPTVNMILILRSEILGSSLVVFGAAARLGALLIAIEMAVAFLLVHHLKLAMGPGSGELAFLYLGGALTILFAGPGRMSVDGAGPA